MKRISLSVAAIAIVLCAASVSFGQTQAGATAARQSIYYDILSQPGCPLNISVHKGMAARITSAPLLITNNQSTTVTAYVLHVLQGSRYGYNYIVFPKNKGLAFGETDNKAVAVGTNSENATNPIISIDYVYFADGKTWGADSLGRSKEIKDFINGHDLAIERLKTLLSGKDDAGFIKALEPYGFSGFGAPVSKTATVDFFAKGYQAVIDGLRRMSIRTDEAKDLAKKLELMKHSS